MESSKIYAVLTGDIVKSSQLKPSQLEEVRGGLMDAVGELKSWKRGLVKGQAEFYRGDAWQLLIAQPASALRAAIFLRAALLQQGIADTRISVGLGTVEQISRSRVSLSTGQAFVVSGHRLDEMPKQSRLSVAADGHRVLASLLPVVGRLCDALIEQWTQRQAELVRLAIAPAEPIQEEIAESLSPPISRQAVNKALDGASWPALKAALHGFEELDWARELAG